MKASVLIPLFATVLLAYDTHAQTTTRRSNENKHVVNDHGIRVEFPSEFELNQSKIGEKPDDIQLQYASKFPNGVYMVTVQKTNADFDADPALRQAYFRILKASFCKAIGGTVLLDDKAGIEDLEGRMIGFDIPAKNGQCLSLMFLENDCWYHVFAMGTKDFVKSTPTVAFLTSVQIKLSE